MELHRSWCFYCNARCLQQDVTHAHIRTHRNVHGCHKGESLRRGCCCTVAASKYTVFFRAGGVRVPDTAAKRKNTSYINTKYNDIFHNPARLGEVERNLSNTSRLAQLRTPRGRPTEPARSPNARHSVPATPCAPPACPAAKSARKDPRPTEKSLQRCKKYTRYNLVLITNIV